MAKDEFLIKTQSKILSEGIATSPQNCAQIQAAIAATTGKMISNFSS